MRHYHVNGIKRLAGQLNHTLSLLAAALLLQDIPIWCMKRRSAQLRRSAFSAASVARPNCAQLNNLSQFVAGHQRAQSKPARYGLQSLGPLNAAMPESLVQVHARLHRVLENHWARAICRCAVCFCLLSGTRPSEAAGPEVLSYQQQLKYLAVKAVSVAG